MKIAICEDLKKDTDYLFGLLSDYLAANSLVADVDTFETADDMLDAFAAGKYQIVFLDIYMKEGGVTGMEAAQKIREIDAEVSIIFTTTSLEHGIESYEVEAAHYIVKPVEKAAFDKAMKKCRTLLNRYAKAIEIMENRQPVTIRLRDIFYAEAQSHSCLVRTTKGETKTSISFAQFVNMLGGFPFIVCHRSYVINLAHVADMQDKDFIMKNGDRIPISKTLKSNAQKAFQDYFWES